MKRRVIVSLIAAVIVVVGTVIILAIPPSTTVQTPCLIRETDCLRLPTITGDNLNGERHTFPADFTQPYQLVVMPFDRDQQVLVLDFVPLLQELSVSRPDLGYYSLAALPDLAAPIRLLVSAGMMAAVSDPAIRQAAHIFYLTDQAAFLQSLDVTDTSATQVYVLDREGNVLWQAGGSFTPELADEIREAIAALPPLSS